MKFLHKIRDKIKNNTFWNIWSSYATYYFGKVNLGIVVPALLSTYQDLSLMNVGLMSSCFFFAYAFGQFLHGQLSERYNPFIYISIGLIGSGIVNLVLGFSAGFFILLMLGEMVDGLFQSMGWSSCVRANALTQTSENIERSSTILGTSYQIGNSIAWLVSAFAVGAWGWQAGFWVAGVILISRGILLLLTKPDIEILPVQKMNIQIKNTLTPPVIFSGLSLCLLNMVRYGVITWIPLYLFQSQNLLIQDMGKVGLNVCLIPIAGVLGTLIYNKIKVNKDMLTMIFLFLLAITFIIFPFTSGITATMLLLLSGFFLYGPHVFLVSTMPTRFIDKQIVAASTGFIDGMGYVGTVLVGIIIPLLVGLAHGDWSYVFIFWSTLSMLVSSIVGVNYIRHFKENK